MKRQLGRRLRELGRGLGLSDAEIARRAGLDPTRYGHYVAGRHYPDLPTLLRICEALATSPDGLLLSRQSSASDNRLLSRLVSAALRLEQGDLEAIIAATEAIARVRRKDGQAVRKRAAVKRR